MARIRTIKPQFFTDDVLSDLSPLARLLFVGLWTLADREGRLEDRPKRIKVELLPYDNVDVDELLNILADHKFITRYTANFHRYIEIRTFAKHQNLNPRESASVIPKIPTDGDASKSRSSRVRTRANLKKLRAHLATANSSGREGNKEGKGIEREATPSVPPRKESLSLSESFLDELQAKPEFAHRDVRFVYQKYHDQCQAEGKPERRGQFVSWLHNEKGDSPNDDGSTEQARRVARRLGGDH